MLKYGEYIDMTLFGGTAEDSYYRGYSKEAIGKGDLFGTADQVAERIATGFKNSKAHWSYVGDSQAEYREISEQITQLGGRITAITDSLARDNSRKDRLQRIQEIIAQRKIDSDTYDDAIVRQMIECIEVFKDGTLLIHFGGGYEIEEHL